MQSLLLVQFKRLLKTWSEWTEVFLNVGKNGSYMVHCRNETARYDAHPTESVKQIHLQVS